MPTKKLLRRFVLLAIGTASMIFCWGCRNHIDVDGRSCSMLTAGEERDLVNFARVIMVRNSPRHATAAELTEIKRTEPELKIKYYGNCIGKAVVSWKLKTRKIEIVFDGVLNSNDPRERDVALRVMDEYPPLIDFRRRPMRSRTSAR